MLMVQATDRPRNGEFELASPDVTASLFTNP
jgi:hypothetical protein